MTLINEMKESIKSLKRLSPEISMSYETCPTIVKRDILNTFKEELHVQPQKMQSCQEISFIHLRFRIWLLGKKSRTIFFFVFFTIKYSPVNA